MTVYNVGAAVKQELDEKMQGMFERYCTAELAKMRMQYHEKAKERDKLNSVLAQLEKDMRLTNTDKLKERYFTKQKDYQTSDYRAQYVKDLESISKL